MTGCRAWSVAVVAAAAVGLLGCDPPESTAAGASASATATAAPKPKPTVQKFTKMPELLIDDMGPYFGGQRADVSKDKGKAKLKKIIENLPINNERVTLRVLKKAKVPWVAEALWQLGQAGAPEVLIKTDGRGDLPKELVVVPESRLGTKPDACSVAVTVNEKFSTGVWSFKGGGGMTHRKGFAGPDLSNTERTLKKALSRCKSKIAFFSADHTLQWEHAYNLGALLRKTDKDKKIESLVLLYNDAVAGRPVKLNK